MGPEEPDLMESTSITYLDINILESPDVPIKRFGAPRSYHHYDGPDSAHVLDPQFLFGFLAKSFDHVFSRFSIRSGFEYESSAVRPVPDGQLYFQHVDTIVLRYNGVKYRTWNVGKFSARSLLKNLTHMTFTIIVNTAVSTFRQ